MFDHSNETSDVLSGLYHTVPDWSRQARATIYTGDIRSPWKSVYGFPMTAARLANGQKLVLHCREDEVFDYLTQLNALLESPEALNQVCHLLNKLARATRQKLDRRLQLREQPLSDSEIPDLMTAVEDILDSSTPDTVAERLACLLSADDPTHEIVGLGKMLSRLRRVMVGLDKVKDWGFRVVVLDRSRQPQRPNLAARRIEATPAEGQPPGIAPNFSAPVQFHLNLWSYLVAKSDRDQSVGWN